MEQKTLTLYSFVYIYHLPLFWHLAETEYFESLWRYYEFTGVIMNSYTSIYVYRPNAGWLGYVQLWVGFLWTVWSVNMILWMNDWILWLSLITQ